MKNKKLGALTVIALISTACTGPLTMKVGENTILQGTYTPTSNGRLFEAKDEFGKLVCTGMMPRFIFFQSDPVPVTCNDGRTAMVRYSSYVLNRYITYDVGDGRMEDGTLVGVFPNLDYEDVKKRPFIYNYLKPYFKVLQ